MHPDASTYTNLQGLSQLRRDAQHAPEKALDGVARQFEAMFVQIMLKDMRGAGGAEGLFDSEQSQLYQEMYDKQLANELSGGLGIAEMLVRQLRDGLPQTTGEARSDRTYPVPPRGAPTEPAEPAAAAPRSAPADPVAFESPEAFVRHLWPRAKGAAERLGVDPEVLVAQAALETGWGKHVIRHPDGGSSHNLFNIKADHRWDGNAVVKQTLEYRDGVAVQERAQFRAYDSFEASFEDYVDFLQSSPRYRGALSRAHQPGAFVEALQDAGYATDPAYARKIRNILEGGVLNDSLAALKVSAATPLT